MDDQVMLLLAGSLLIISVAAIVFYILLVVAYWKIFKKAGEKGWKSIIPVYNNYIQFKITWNTKMFWAYLIINILMCAFTSAADSSVCAILAGVCGIAAVVIYVMSNYKFAKAFGHGVGFTILMILFPNIMTLILGFGGSEYQGPQ